MATSQRNASWKNIWQKLRKLMGAAEPIPEHWKHKRIKELSLLAIDLELTSLDTEQAKITSIGWVEGKHGCIQLSSSYYQIVRAKDLKQSPVIHGLTEEDIAQGAHVSTAIEKLIPYSQDYVWVFHNASLDTAVLDKVLKSHGVSANVVTIDTLKLAMYQLKKQYDVLPSNSVTLEQCRRRYNLPEAPAHNALDDALSTIEVLFAQFDKLKASELTLDEMAHTQAIKLFSLGCSPVES